MRRFGAYLGLSLLFWLVGFSSAQAWVPGDLDADFGSGGTILTEFPPGGGGERGQTVAVGDDGKIVVAGQYEDDFAVARYNGDGTLDGSFGAGGLVSTDLGGVEEAMAVIILPDGKIMAAGYTNSAGPTNFAVVRYNANGSLDTSFGTGGLVITDVVSGYNDLARAMTYHYNGKVIVGGYTQTPFGDLDFALVRYNSDGTLDSGFGSGGKVVTDIGGQTQEIYGLAMASGQIVAVGVHYNGIDTDFVLARYNGDGTLDSTFGSGGSVVTDSGGWDYAYGLAVQADDKIVAVGSHSLVSGEAFGLDRFNTDGTPDAGFGIGGRVTTDFGGSDSARAAAVQSDGKIVVAGAGTANGDFVIARYNASGALDATFGSAGYVTTNFGNDDRAMGMAIQSDGKIVAAGYRNATGVYDIALARYHARLPRTLTVSKAGSGTGTVTSSPAGIDCGADCSESFYFNSWATLTATPGAGSRFRQWTGDYVSSEPTISLAMDADHSVSAEFVPDTASAFETADLAGTWYLHELTSGDGPSDDVRWAYGTLEVDASGHAVDTITEPDGVYTGTLDLVLDANGILSAPSLGPLFHGVISDDKRFIALTFEEPDGNQLAVAVKRNPAITFSTGDLAGTWYIHNLISGDGPSQTPHWGYGTLTLDSAGHGAGEMTTPFGSGTFTHTFQVTSNGIVTSSSIGPKFRGTLSDDKRLFLMTNESSDGNELGLAVRRHPAAAFQTDDMTGEWHFHGLISGDGPSQSPQWTRAMISVAPSGNATVTGVDPNGVYTTSITLETDTDGVVICPSCGPLPRGVLSDDRTISLLTGESSDGYELSVGIRRGAPVTPGPSTSLSITVPAGTTPEDYRIVSVPLQCDDPSAAAVLGGQLGSYDPTQMRVGQWDAASQTYLEYPFTCPLNPGWTGWFLFRNGRSLTFSGSDATTSTGPFGSPGLFCTLLPGWNLVGNPFRSPVAVSGMVVQDQNGARDYLIDSANTITQRVFWVYSAGSYSAGSTLAVGQGGWLKKLTPGAGYVFFPASSPVPDRVVDPIEMPDDLERPPAPPTGFDDPISGSSGGGGGCFIGGLAR